MQADDEVGKIAQAVPIIISRTLELFVESLLTKSSQITIARNAKTLSPTHLKQCINSESRFDFLKDLVKNIPDIAVDDATSSVSSHTSHNDDHQHNSINNGSAETSNNGSHRIHYQRSQSLQQPSTSSNQHLYQNTAAPATSVQQKKFYLNNYTSIPTNNNNSNNNNNISNSVLNNTKLNPNIPSTVDSYSPPPAKIFRINSSPASATITSAEHRQQQKQSLAPLEFPIKISYNIDGSSTTSNINSPAVKIDYSNLTLPATSPSIKIDLSQFNAHLASSTTSSSTNIISSIQPSSNATTIMPSTSSTSGGLDEDYDT